MKRPSGVQLTLAKPGPATTACEPVKANGRPPLLRDRPGLAVLFVKSIREGATPDRACIEHDVALTSFKEWMRWGTMVDELGASVGKEPYLSFARDVMGALTKYEGALITEITRQGRDARDPSGKILLDTNGRVARAGDARHLQWILERRFPKKYSLQIRAALERELRGVVTTLERGLDPETFAKVRDVLTHSETSGSDDIAAPEMVRKILETKLLGEGAEHDIDIPKACAAERALSGGVLRVAERLRAAGILLDPEQSGDGVP